MVLRMKKKAIAPTIPAIDPSLPKARAAILAAFPAVLRPMQVAPEEARAIVSEYAEARTLAKACETSQEVAGNALALMIGDCEGIAGDDFSVTWLPREGSTNWKGLAEQAIRQLRKLGAAPMAIPDPKDWQGPPTRVLAVKIGGSNGS